MSEYRTALVTGASSGLGRGLALALARRGTTVYAAARRKDRLDSLVEEGGGRIRSLILDVSDGDATYAAVRALDEKDALDLVIANAGVGGPTRAQKIDWPLLKSILMIDFVGAAATCAGALPGMVARDRGHVVGISSIAAWRGLPGNAGYSGAKAGFATFLESLRVDLHGSGVHVTTIFPGFVKTEMTAKNKFPMPFILELDHAVHLMMRAIDKRAAEYAFPLPLAAAAGALPFLPSAVYEFVASKSKV